MSRQWATEKVIICDARTRKLLNHFFKKEKETFPILIFSLLSKALFCHIGVIFSCSVLWFSSVLIPAHHVSVFCHHLFIWSMCKKCTLVSGSDATCHATSVSVIGFTGIKLVKSRTVQNKRAAKRAGGWSAGHPRHSPPQKSTDSFQFEPSTTSHLVNQTTWSWTRPHQLSLTSWPLQHLFRSGVVVAVM